MKNVHGDGWRIARLWLRSSMLGAILVIAACGGGGGSSSDGDVATADSSNDSDSDEILAPLTREQAESKGASSAACRNRSNNNFHKLLECMTLDGVRRHQAAFQAIADANGGTRVSGTPGFDQSAAYAERVLRQAGYRVTRQEFQFQTFIALS
ncbi:MAG TPA: hypothetical protein VHQ87_17660, partial [Rhizobacter sp.]|nr:hypothetical protein [Rhizobacter sp.]